MANASTESLVTLIGACEPETYQEAAKLDPSKFSFAFDPVRYGLISAIKDQLWHGGLAETPLDCELLKLNVYGTSSRLANQNGKSGLLNKVIGKDMSLKAYGDIPPTENMVGTLVVIFPTPHSGGEFMLHHRQNRWTFDEASLVSSQPSPSIAYIAFDSDAEHEVLKITDGHRVTITYHIYISPSAAAVGTRVSSAPIVWNIPGLTHSRRSPESTAVGTRVSSSPIVRDVTGLTHFKRSLEAMLRDEFFMPNGGTLGFGMQYKYPVTYQTKMSDLKNGLRGSDAYVWSACSDLGLEPRLWVIYEKRVLGLLNLGLNPSRVRILAEKYYKPQSGYYGQDLLAQLTQSRCYKVNVVNGVEARQEGVDGYWPDDNKAIQVI